MEKAATRSGWFDVPIMKKPMNEAICAAFGAVGPLTPTKQPPNNPPNNPPKNPPEKPGENPK